MSDAAGRIFSLLLISALFAAGVAFGQARDMPVTVGDTASDSR